MTDRYNALTVVLSKDVRDDDAQGLMEAILMLRGVLRVDPNVADFDDHLAESRAKAELRSKLLTLLSDD